LFLLVEETTTVRTHSIEEKESKTSAMLENRDAKLHDCFRSAAQQRNDAASQQMAANLKSVKGTRKDIPVGDSGLENAIYLASFNLGNMTLENKGKQILESAIHVPSFHSRICN
jgi:hypothetical protein